MHFYLLLLLSLFVTNLDAQSKIYLKDYYSSGQLKSEGWMQDELKQDYWIFYHSNGHKSAQGSYDQGEKSGYWFFYNEHEKLIKEGHYQKDQEEGWWTFYDLAAQKESRCQCRDNLKHGYCLIYEKGRLKRVDHYHKGQKIRTWSTLSAFRKDNPEVKFR
ncbi:toxin-antitoxin system YwqK family antitoxin [Croceiramulus getboli]|nr:hypothetical protein P8624_02425 [Flavobacteriaceae bacterium YJPT1-3]